MSRSYLSDEQLWTLVLASPEANDKMLAIALEANCSTVRNARWRLRRNGWTCRVSYAVCEVCGEPMTLQGFRSTTQRYHHTCRPVAFREMSKAHYRVRKARISEHERDEYIDRLHSWDDAGQAQSRAVAVNQRNRWTPEEDSIVLDHGNRSLLDVALELGRSLRAVKRRKHFLIHGT